MRDDHQIFNSNNTFIAILCSGFCGYFSLRDTNSIIFSILIFIITFLLSFDIDVIRGNNKKQPINQYLFLSGLFASLILLIIFKNKNDLITPFLVLVLPLMFTAFYNLIFLLKKINLLKKKSFLSFEITKYLFFRL